ncbi:hypothetical protein OAL72_00955 [bacterium]|nr:hypothetical protein [bacterium]
MKTTKMIQSELMSMSKGEEIKMAKSNNTSPNKLAELSHVQNRKAHRMLAFNPNTPEEILQTLWIYWPEAILENPIIDIWDLTESIPLCERLNKHVIWAWYHYLTRTKQHDKINTYIPIKYRYEFPLNYTSLAYWLAEDPSKEIRIKVASQTRKPEVQAILARDEDNEVKIALASNYHISTYCHRVLAAYLKEDVQLAVARNNRVEMGPDNGFEILLYSDFDAVRAEAAGNPKVLRDHLAKISLKDESIKVRVQAAKNANLGIELHKQTQSTNRVPILEALAENKFADTEFLTRLATSKNPRLRAAAARNPKTPGALQMKLCRDENPKVRENFVGLHECGNNFFDAAVAGGDRELKCKLADMSGRSKDQLIALATDSDVPVRRAVARRLKRGRFQHYTDTNVELVDLLSKDCDYKIRRAMVSDYRLNQKRLDEMAYDKGSTVRKEVARHHNTGTAGLALLLKDKVFRVRFQAALNVLRKCWSWGRHNGVLPLMDVKHLGSCLSQIEKLLLIAAKDPSEKIRRLISSHKWTPAKVLASMIHDSDKTVHKQLSARSEFPRDAMIRLAQQNDGRSLFKYTLTLSGKVLARLAKSRNEFTRAMAARNCRTPIVTLKQLALDKSSFVKLKLEQNPKYNR